MKLWRTDPHVQSLFTVFLHVNRELTDFQREVLKDVIQYDHIAAAIERTSEKMLELKSAGWKPQKQDSNAVLKPDHYDRFPMEPTYFLVMTGDDWPWTIANFVKYVVRFPFKNGIEDLGKARRNLEMHWKWREGDLAWSR